MNESRKFKGKKTIMLIATAVTLTYAIIAVTASNEVTTFAAKKKPVKKDLNATIKNLLKNPDVSIRLIKKIANQKIEGRKLSKKYKWINAMLSTYKKKGISVFVKDGKITNKWKKLQLSLKKLISEEFEIKHENKKDLTITLKNGNLVKVINLTKPDFSIKLEKKKINIIKETKEEKPEDNKVDNKIEKEENRAENNKVDNKIEKTEENKAEKIEKKEKETHKEHKIEKPEENDSVKSEENKITEEKTTNKTVEKTEEKHNSHVGNSVSEKESTSNIKHENNKKTSDENVMTAEEAARKAEEARAEAERRVESAGITNAQEAAEAEKRLKAAEEEARKKQEEADNERARKEREEQECKNPPPAYDPNEMK